MNDRELKQRAMIENTWRSLNELVEGLLKRRSGGTGGVRAISAGGADGWADPRRLPMRLPRTGTASRPTVT